MPGFDEVAHVYDATRSLRPDVMAKVVDGLVQFLGSSSLIDFGVGTGRFASPLLRKGVKVVGLDLSLPMITRARDKGVADLALAAAEHAPFREQTFEYAMVVHFVHLIGDWGAVIREIRRVARRGMIAVVDGGSAPNARDLYAELRERMGFKLAGLKRGERDLVSMVKPTLVRDLARYIEEFDPPELLREYSSKLHSITWDVPDDVNVRIVEEMRADLGQRRKAEWTKSLAFWDSDRLRGFDHSP